MAASGARCIWERDRGLCGICGQPVVLGAMQLDHIIPRSLGGPTTPENLRTAHPTCNNRRRNKPDWTPEPGHSPPCLTCGTIQYGAAPGHAYCSNECAPGLP